jgi:galactokinase
MDGHTLLEKIKTDDAASLFDGLYGPDAVAGARKRYTALVEGISFMKASREVRMFSVPGRTELAGNHTDHNRGKVLAAAIQADIAAAVSPRDDKRVIFRSTGFADVEADISALAPRKQEEGTTAALLRGVAAEFAAHGVEAGGFTANADSAVPPGSGLSSSAAIEVLFGSIFNSLYGNGRFNALQLAQFGQHAENDYFGKPSGLMDQAACSFGGVIAIDFEHPDAPKIEPVAFDPERAGYALCIAATGGSHADLTADYAAIPDEMGAVARFLGKNSLRDADLAGLLARVPELRKEAGDRAVLRSIHYFNENARVTAMKDALERLNGGNGDVFSEYLRLVSESGDSSWELLQNIFSPANPARQGIALGLALTREFLKTHTTSGACRVHGGGFAGAIQAYIPLGKLPAYRDFMEAAFGKGSVTRLRIRPLGAVELRF